MADERSLRARRPAGALLAGSSMTAASNSTPTRSNAQFALSPSAARIICSLDLMVVRPAGRWSPHCWPPPSSMTSSRSPTSRTSWSACAAAIR